MENFVSNRPACNVANFFCKPKIFQLKNKARAGLEGRISGHRSGARRLSVSEPWKAGYLVEFSRKKEKIFTLLLAEVRNREAGNSAGEQLFFFFNQLVAAVDFCIQNVGFATVAGFVNGLLLGDFGIGCFNF